MTWPTVALGDVAQINPRGQRLNEEASVSFVGMAQLDAVSAVAVPLENRSFGEVSVGYTQFQDGDILAAKITPCWENGKIGIAKLDREVGLGSTEFHVVRPGPEVDKRYILHFLRQDSIRKTGELRMTGSAGQRRVPAKYLMDLGVPLPSLEEQRRIAAILDQADAIRTRRKVFGQLANELQNAVTGAILNSTQWVGTIADLADVQIGPFGSLLHKSDYVSDGVCLINPTHIQDGEIVPDPAFSVSREKADGLRNYRLREGDVILGRRGEMGRSASVGPDHDGMLCGTGSVIVRPKMEGSGELVKALLSSERMRDHLTRASLGATLPNLNAGIVKSAPAPELDARSVLSFQRLSKTWRDIRSAQQAARRVDDELFTALQTRAFKGAL